MTISKIILSALTSLLYLNCTAQLSSSLSDSIPKLPSLLELEAALTAYTEQECQAELKAYEVTKGKAWKELMPSIGLGYTVVGSLRPSVNWSPLQILERKEKRQKQAYDRESIVLSCQLLLSDRLHKLRQLYQDYQVDLHIIAARRSTLAIDEELFAITERKYQEHLIKPSEYLAAKRRILQARADMAVMVLEVEKLRHEVLWFGKWREN